MAARRADATVHPTAVATFAQLAPALRSSGGERGIQVSFLNFLVHFGALPFRTRGTAQLETAWLLRSYEARMFSAGPMTVYLLCALAWWPVAARHRGALTGA